jgi:hypothetical protein
MLVQDGSFKLDESERGAAFDGKPCGLYVNR